MRPFLPGCISYKPGLFLGFCLAIAACKSGSGVQAHAEALPASVQWMPDLQAWAALSYEALEDSLRYYETQPDINLQRRAFFVYYNVAMQGPEDRAKRKLIISKLLRTCADSLKNSYSCQPCGSYLLDFDVTEFDQQARDKISWIINRSDYATAYYPQPADYLPYKEYVLLAGKLYLRETQDRLVQLSNPASLYQHRWEVRLALARLGDQAAIHECIAKIKAGLKPGILPPAGALDQLAYIHNEAVIEAYNIFLYSDDPMPDQSHVDGFGAGPSSAAFIIRYYAYLLEGFPLPARHIYYDELYSTAEIALARQWVQDNKGRYKLKS